MNINFWGKTAFCLSFGATLPLVFAIGKATRSDPSGAIAGGVACLALIALGALAAKKAPICKSPLGYSLSVWSRWGCYMLLLMTGLSLAKYGLDLTAQVMLITVAILIAFSILLEKYLVSIGASYRLMRYAHYD
jgi:hypothetical protein